MRKKVYLTIDDSPNESTIKKVDLLNEKNIEAIFFCRGDYMEKNMEIARYIVAKGHVIGNHSYSHKHFSDYTIEECRNQIIKTDQIIQQIYDLEGKAFKHRYFRYPFGMKANIPYSSKKIFFRKFSKKFNTVEKTLKELNYKPLKIDNFTKRYPEKHRNSDTDTFWTFDIAEWKVRDGHKTVQQTLERIDVELSPERGNEILMMHDNNSYHDVFETVLNHIVQKEIEFLPLPK